MCGSSRWTAYYRSISPSSYSAGPSFHTHCPTRAKGRRVFQAYRIPATAGAPGARFTSRVLFGASNARCRSAYGQHGCPDTASHPRSGRQARRTSRCSKAQSARSDRSSPVARGASAGRHRLLGLRLSWIGHSLIGVWWGPGHQAGLSHRAVSFGFTFLGGAGSRLRSTAREERQSAGIEPHTSGQKRTGPALYR